MLRVSEDTHEKTGDGSMGTPDLYAADQPLDARKALVSLAVFLSVVVAASTGATSIAAAAFAGAVLLFLLRVITPEQAYAGLRTEVLLVIALAELRTRPLISR